MVDLTLFRWFKTILYFIINSILTKELNFFIKWIDLDLYFEKHFLLTLLIEETANQWEGNL